MGSELSAKLDDVLPEYRRVDKAPKLSALEWRAESSGRSLHSVIEEEKLARYKAIDLSGGVFLLQNPAILTCQSVHGADRIVDIIRERVATIKDAKRSSKSTRNNSSMDIGI